MLCDNLIFEQIPQQRAKFLGSNVLCRACLLYVACTLALQEDPGETCLAQYTF